MWLLTVCWLVKYGKESALWFLCLHIIKSRDDWVLKSWDCSNKHPIVHLCNECVAATFMCLCKNHISKITIPIKIPQRWNVQSSFCFQINIIFLFLWKLLFFNVTCISHFISPSSPPGLWAARAEEQEVEERGKHTATSVSVCLLQTILFYINSSKSCLYEMHKNTAEMKTS